MKNILFTIFVFTVLLITPSGANAQMMGRFSNSTVDWDKVVEHTLREEQEGKELWSKLQAKEITCTNLNDEQYGVLGEYFMWTMSGDSHPAMNAMMIQAHGEDGEEQIHIALGKRLSVCDTSATLPVGSSGWMPMMWGGWSSPVGFNNNNNNSMMWSSFGNAGWGFGFGWIFMLLFWGLIIWGIIALLRGVSGHGCGGHNHGEHGRSSNALDILKERYAKGEIDKNEFEEKKKDLN